jgi:hypothetical protein
MISRILYYKVYFLLLVAKWLLPENRTTSQATLQLRRTVERVKELL